MEPTEAQRLAVAARTKDDALAISTSSIAAMNRTQAALEATATGSLKASAVSRASVGAAVTPHYYGPYGNYANSPQHLPTALVTFSEPPHVAGWRVAAGTAVVDANGVVTGVTVTDAGCGYTSAPAVTIAGIGSGSGATAAPVMTNGIGGLTLTQVGLGYNDPVTVSFVGGGGIGATANAVIDPHGAIASLSLTSAGHGFVTRPAVRFTDPVGAASVPAVATATLTKLVASVTVTHGGTGYVTPGIRKFVDTLPVPGSVGADGTNTVTKNDLGQYLPVAIPDTTTYPGDDYYEIAVVQYREQLHKDLPAQGTLLRGYVQLSTPVIPGKHVALYNDLVDGTRVPIKLPNGDQAYGVDQPQYLGPIVNAEKNRPRPVPRPPPHRRGWRPVPPGRHHGHGCGRGP